MHHKEKYTDERKIERRSGARDGNLGAYLQSPGWVSTNPAERGRKTGDREADYAVSRLERLKALDIH